MNKAKENLIKIAIVVFAIWVALLIVGLVTRYEKIISNVFFGMALCLALPILYVFFKNKSLKKHRVSKFEVENYLTSRERQELETNKSRLDYKVKARQAVYLIIFSLLHVLILIVSAVLILHL